MISRAGAGTGAGTGTATVHLSVSDRVATVSIDDPGRLNAVTRSTCRALIEAFRSAEADPGVDAVVLRGAGGTFSAGAAIDQIEAVLQDDSGGGAPVDWLSAADEALGALSKPTFAWVQGACFGGAWMLASAADVCLVSDDTRLALTPAKLGILYPRRGLERLVARVGEDRAKYILFTAEEIPARRAEEWGLVTRVVAAEDFERECARVLERVMAQSRHSVAVMKEAVSGPDPDGVWEREWAGSLSSPDTRARVEAFLAHR